MGRLNNLIYNESQLDAALTAVGTGGGLLLLAPTFSPPASKTITVASTSPLVIAGASPNVRSRLPNLVIGGGSQNITLRNLDHGDSASLTGACLNLSSTGAPPKNIEVDNCDFYGQELDPYGAYSGGAPTARTGLTGAFENLTVRNCFFRSLTSCLKPSTQFGDFIAVWNWFDLYYEDAISTGASNDSGTYIISNNFMTRPCGLGSDTGNPHSDAVQVRLVGANHTLISMVTEGNIRYQGDARGVGQANLNSSDDDGGIYIEGASRFNLWISGDPSGNPSGANSGDTHAPEFYWMSSGSVYANIIARGAPGTGTGSLTTIGRTYAGEPPSIVGDGVGSLFNGRGSNLINNTVIANVEADYLDAFDGINGSFTSFSRSYGTRANLIDLKAKVVAAFKPKIGGPIEHLRDMYDYETGLPNWSETRSYLPIANVRDLGRSVVYTTGWLPVINGPDGQSISVPAGTTWQKADDSSGTNATSATSTSGVVDRGQYVQLIRTTSPDYSESVSYGVTLNGYAYSKYLTTDSQAQFATADNAGAAYSRISAAPGTEPAQKKAFIVIRAKMDVVANSKALVGTALGTVYRFTTSAGVQTFLFRTSGTISAVNVDSYDTAFHTHMFWIDLNTTSTDPSDVFRWYIDGERVILSEGSTILTGGATSFDPFTLFDDLQLMAQTATPGDGQTAFHWMHWGDATYNLPDTSDPVALNNMFSADNIGLSDGSGALGYQPKMFWYTATGAAGWNAGFPNLGFLAGLNMNPIAGTYT